MVGAKAHTAKRFEVFLVVLDPTRGSEIRKTRPCLVISPDEMNSAVRTVIIAPMTTKGRSYPTRVECQFQGQTGQIVLDQIRAVDTSCLTRRLGKIDKPTSENVLTTIAKLFAP